ncbi:Transmembrane BAX inhibitor motif-containing protein 4 [Dinochytrium kinnereticum]|nr:Transmembrane BAX inhibitor motif-containing protein 4 [Dinochytrium kinnereticum]
MADVESGTTYQPGYGAVPTYSESEPPTYANANEQKETMENAAQAIRLSFVRKVYSILAAQLGLTTIVTALFMFSVTIKTFVQSNTIGTVCTFYDSMVVLQAAVLTFALFIGLTLFTVQSRVDFSGMAPFLFGALWIVVIASFVQLFLPFSRFVDLVFAIIIAILFCGYIVFDTYQLFNRFCPEEYIVASIELYLDILNLFLAILRILGNSRD